MLNEKKYIVFCKLVLAILFIVCILSGCSSNKNHEKLIIVGCETASMVSQKTEDEINRYIKEQGCDYTVKFIDLCENIGKEFEDISTVEYAEYIECYVNEGNKLDICLAGRMLDGAWKGSYEILIEDGYLYKLDDYLNSEIGMELYDSIPKSKWESNRYMDGIYGVNAYAYNCQTGVAYVVNNDIMEKYNLSIDDVNKPLDELADILKNVQIGESSNGGFADKNELYAQIYANADVSPYLGFRFDRTGYENYVYNSNEVICKLYKLFSEETKDFDTYIYSLLQEYKSCGGEKLFEAIEEQYKQFVHNR